MKLAELCKSQTVVELPLDQRLAGSFVGNDNSEDPHASLIDALEAADAAGDPVGRAPAEAKFSSRNLLRQEPLPLCAESAS